MLSQIISSGSILSIFDAEALIRYGGLLLMCLLVYASTGLFFCFFLPSGAVLFTGGILIASGTLRDNIFIVCMLLIIASVLGNLTGYWFGIKAGPALYRRKDSKFFRKQYLVKAKEFYHKHGDKALTAGFFIPIVRTFGPIVTGVIRLNFRRFMLPTIAGSVLWVISFVSIGYFIGAWPVLRPWLSYIVAAFILIVTLPLVIRVMRGLKK